MCVKCEVRFWTLITSFRAMQRMHDLFIVGIKVDAKTIGIHFDFLSACRKYTGSFSRYRYRNLVMVQVHVICYDKWYRYSQCQFDAIYPSWHSIPEEHTTDSNAYCAFNKQQHPPPLKRPIFPSRCVLKCPKCVNATASHTARRIKAWLAPHNASRWFH